MIEFILGFILGTISALFSYSLILAINYNEREMNKK